MKKYGSSTASHGLRSHSSASRDSLRSLVWSLVKAHRASYTVLALTVFVTSLLLCSTLQVYTAGKMMDGAVGMDSMNTLRRLMAVTPYQNVVVLSTVSVLCIGLVAVFLVLASVSSLVQNRRREYGMMRLNGAGRLRIMVMALGEFSLPLALANAVGCLAGSLLTVPMGMAVNGPAEFPGSGMLFRPRIRPVVSVLAFVFMMVVCLLGVWLAVRKIGKATPLELMGQEPVKDTGRMGWLRSVVAGVLLLITLIVGFAPIGVTLDVRCMLLVILVISTVYASSPLLVSVSVSLVGLVPEKLAEGPGILARQRARRKTEGSMSIALPVMMVLTIVVSFLAVLRAGSIGGNMLNLRPLKADVVATADTSSGVDRIDSSIRDLGDAVNEADIYQTQQWAVEGSDSIFQVAWHEGPGRLPGGTGVTAPKVVKGSLADLGPGRIAVSNEHADYRLGDKVTLLDRHDRRYRLTVVAIVDPPEGMPELPMDFLSSADGLPRSGELDELIAMVSASSSVAVNGILKGLQETGVRGMRVETRAAFIDRFVRRGVSGQHALSVMIVGGTVLAMVFLVQSIAIALAERRRQDHRLYQIGVSHRSIIWSAILEIMVDAFSGILIAMVAVCVVVAALAAAFNGAGIGVSYTPIPVGSFCLIGLLLLIIGVAATFEISRSMLGDPGSEQ
ncbi:putative ABC transport system permease protein [Bifidobacterium commune]|uniref:Putative ABC transport system permease protein n=1 Tax=Bifidobacterium commune TaxID=1505727 RepID=A0A1C4H5X9_9BIFI|nr:ABC transporter permease [Bifidobacterium commune]MBB2955786.1 putative ABC transport system permease protein [Bifidobacterium commune]SCC80060.1 putative ABC transport system permease protein [Bifidobacterium commune]